MEIVVGKTAGFCFGVRRAIELAENSLRNGENVYSLGRIVHNKVVNDELAQKGLIFADSIYDIPNKSKVIIRAHGVTPDEFRICKEKELEIIDTTCPNVKKIHDIVQEKSKEGYRTVIIGDKNHPEVIGISGWAGDSHIVISDEKEIEKIDGKKICVVSQTTMNFEKNEAIARKIKEKFTECDIYNTICNATEDRQNELRMLAKDSDYIIIVGDKSSANSNRLYEIAKKYRKTQFIENISDLHLNFLETSCRILIMAGASTPQSIIDEVKEKLKNF